MEVQESGRYVLGANHALGSRARLRAGDEKEVSPPFPQAQS